MFFLITDFLRIAMEYFLKKRVGGSPMGDT